MRDMGRHVEVRMTPQNGDGTEPARQSCISIFSMLEARRCTSPATSIALRFGRRLRLLRRQHGMTQASLSVFLGIDRSYISDVECGKKVMSLSYLETVAQGFNMTVAELVEGL